MKLILRGTPAVLEQLAVLTEQARTLLSEHALADSTPLVPYDTHALANSALSASSPEQGILAWNTPYARIRYYTGTPRHAETTTHWLDVAAERHAAAWVGSVQQQLAGGE